MNNAQLMRELKESEEIKQVINHLTQDIIDWKMYVAYSC